MVLPSHRGPIHPGESRVKLLPRQTLPLTASIQPFEEYPLHLVLEGLTPRQIIRDGVVSEITHQPTLGELQQFASPVPMAGLLQPALDLFQFAPKLLSGSP